MFPSPKLRGKSGFYSTPSSDNFKSLSVSKPNLKATTVKHDRTTEHSKAVKKYLKTAGYLSKQQSNLQLAQLTSLYLSSPDNNTDDVVSIKV